MSVHAILFTWLNGTADYYAQARIYPIASILSFIMDSDHGPWFPSIFFVSVLVVNLISAYVFIPRLQKTIAGSAPATDEQPEQVQSTRLSPGRRKLLTIPLTRWSGCRQLTHASACSSPSSLSLTPSSLLMLPIVLYTQRAGALSFLMQKVIKVSSLPPGLLVFSAL